MQQTKNDNAHVSFILTIMQDRGLSYGRTAKSIGISKSHFFSIINYNKPCSRRFKILIADYFQLPYVLVWGDSND